MWSDTGYVALFVWSFLAATILPIGSEALVVAMTLRDVHGPTMLVVATVGNTLGAITTYLLARKAAQIVEPRGTAKRALDLVARYGYPALLLSWVPIIGDAIVAAAGASGMRLMPFVMMTALGKLIRYWLLIFAVARVSS